MPELTHYVHTFGQWLRARHGERVHKIALNAGFTCPNRDGSKGIGGCTFCNNASFNADVAQRRSGTPAGMAERPAPSTGIAAQMLAGRRAAARYTNARKYLAYFQAYTNTYADVAQLRRLYDEALAQEGVIGLSVGTRPDCVPKAVLDLLAAYRDQGHEVWLELGLQSAFDVTLARVNRGHGLREYLQSCRAARRMGIPVCTHLIIGLPGETAWHAEKTLETVLDVGTDGLKLHPLHVVKGTRLANEWRRGEYTPWSEEDYVTLVADLIERTPWEVVFHRLTGTAPANLLLAPQWCAHKWPVVNAIVAELVRRDSRQGVKAGLPASLPAQAQPLSAQRGCAV
ncbi:MAG: TIGR01212 family radical SAM protein [Thiobacillaceae bacterium]